MPVVSTEVLEMLRGLGLDDARALKAATAVGAARDEAERKALGEIAALRATLTNLTESLTAEAAASRAATELAAAAAAEAQRAAGADALAALKAEGEALRRALAASDAARAAAEAKAASALGTLTMLAAAALGVGLLGVVVALVT